MENLLEVPGGDDREFKPDPRDILQVISDYCRRTGKGEELTGGVEVWEVVEGLPEGKKVTFRIEDEYTDVVIVESPVLHVEDNSFTGVIFRKGSVKELEEVFGWVKPLIEAEGGQF